MDTEGSAKRAARHGIDLLKMELKTPSKKRKISTKEEKGNMVSLLEDAAATLEAMETAVETVEPASSEKNDLVNSQDVLPIISSPLQSILNQMENSVTSFPELMVASAVEQCCDHHRAGQKNTPISRTLKCFIAVGIANGTNNGIHWFYKVSRLSRRLSERSDCSTS